jgi:GMP synthase (glutamine-hydrolysing)
MIERPKILVTEHAEGRVEGISELLCQKGAEVTVVKNYLGEPLPPVSEFDGVISGGGPMGVYEVYDNKHEFLAREKDFLVEAAIKGKAVLGICLGHQLLVSALGGEVGMSLDTAEFGWSKITLTQDGIKDSLFKDIPTDFMSFEYHKDQVFSLPVTAIKLATSSLCEIQAFRYSHQPVWGVQFHPEISPEKAEKILMARRDVVESGGLDIFPVIKQGYHADQDPRKQIFYNFVNLLK